MCDSFNCEENVECHSQSDLSTAVCLTEESEEIEAGQCPEDHSEDEYYCNLRQTKRLCMGIDSKCAWCSREGTFECVPDQSALAGGEI